MNPDFAREGIRLECARAYLAMCGWSHEGGWRFRAPGGSLHDLGASDVLQHKRIEAEGLALVVE